MDRDHGAASCTAIEQLMPTRPLRPCAWPGCGAITAKRFCSHHEQEEYRRQDARRGSSGARGYGARWRKLRAAVLREEPFCRECGVKGVRVAATEVDHIIPKPLGTDARENLQSLCTSHHSAKTMRQSVHQQGGVRNFGQERSVTGARVAVAPRVFTRGGIPDKPVAAKGLAATPQPLINHIDARS